MQITQVKRGCSERSDRDDGISTFCLAAGIATLVVKASNGVIAFLESNDEARKLRSWLYLEIWPLLLSEAVASGNRKPGKSWKTFSRRLLS